MSADTRSPVTDALETLGMIHFKPEARDAIHLAVEPVKAGRILRPGTRIGIVNGVAYPLPCRDYPFGHEPVEGEPTEVVYHGIVDPFLTVKVPEGESFWFVMAPRMVKSLRHVWEHPDFPEGK